MLVRILTDCRADGRHLPCGEVVDISEDAARILIAIGRAEHSSVTVDDVAPSSTDETAYPKPAARRGRSPATPTTTTEED